MTFSVAIWSPFSCKFSLLFVNNNNEADVYSRPQYLHSKFLIASSMDRGQRLDQDPPSSPTKPLRIRKQPSPVRVSRSQQPSDGDSNRPPRHSSHQHYPPRTSSLLGENDSGVSGKGKSRERIHGRQKGDNSSTGRSMPSNTAYNSISDPPIGDFTERSTVSSLKERYLSGSTEITGDFVPVNADMAFSSREAEHHRVSPRAQVP